MGKRIAVAGLLFVCALAGCGAGDGTIVDAGAYDNSPQPIGGPKTASAPADVYYPPAATYRAPPPATPTAAAPKRSAMIPAFQGPPIDPADLPPGKGWACYTAPMGYTCERTMADCGEFRAANVAVWTRGEGAMSRADVEASLGQCTQRTTVWGHISILDDGKKFLQFYETKEQCMSLAVPPEGLDPAQFQKPGETGCGELP